MTNTRVKVSLNGNSQLAKSWAVGDGLIQGEDYSAKKYAGDAHDSADLAEHYVGVIEENQDTLTTIATDLDKEDLPGEHSAIIAVDGSLANVNIVANDISNVNAVAGNQTNIDAVKTNETNINTVAGAEANVNIVATNIANVNTVGTDLALNASSEIKKVNANKTNIDKVAAIDSKVTTVANNDSNVTTVATDLDDEYSNIKTVATNILNVNAVANNSTNITAVAGNATNINAVNANKTNINAVVSNATNINAVAGNSTNINAVNANKTNIDAVAGNESNITAVAGNATNINAVNANKTNINAVNANKTNIDTVASNNSNITTVATNIANITAVKNDLTNINAVKNDLTNIDTVATNIADVNTVADNISTVAAKQNVITLANDSGLKASVVSAMSIIGENNSGRRYDEPKTLAKMISAAHSTYCGDQPSTASPLDPKKFVKVGSPVITSDGIASGFSSGNYITKALNVTGTSYKIKCRFLQDNTTGGKWVFNLGGVGVNISYDNNRMYINKGDTSLGNFLATSLYALNDYIDIVFEVTATTATLTASCQGTTLTPLTVTNTFDVASGITTIALAARDTNYLVNSNITLDLKYFDVEANNIPVFSGNRTGIDTIKPDDYSAISSGTLPTISDDGIASNFTATSFIDEGTLGKTPTQSWKRTAKFKTPAAWSNGVIDAIGDGSGYSEAAYIESSNNGNLRATFAHTGNTTTRFEISSPQLNTWYVVEYGQYVSGTSVYSYLNYKTANNTNYTSITPSTAITAIIPTSTSVLRIGNYIYNQPLAFTGEIDLNASRTYVDGNLVYQPCLKIPYTQSKTGSKVVNAVYRDRVNDMAEQFGVAPYHILDEDNGNFAFPYGSVEEKVAPKIVVGHYEDGASAWEQYLDRTMIQRGTMIADTPVTFPCSDAFADTNYSLSCPYSAKSKTGFTPTVSGEYIAVGKV